MQHGEPGRQLHPGRPGPLPRTGGTVNLAGTLDNTGTTLVLDAATGSWNLTAAARSRGAHWPRSTAPPWLPPRARDAGRRDLGGTVTGQAQPGTVAFVATGGLTVTGGMTLADGTVLQVGDASHAGEIDFVGDETVGGTGTLAFVGLGGTLESLANVTLGPGITVHGTSGVLFILTGSLTNQGTIEADGGGTLDIHGNPGTSWTNGGVLQVVHQGVLSIDVTGPITASGILTSSASGTMTISGNLVGDTTDSDLYNPQGIVRLDGSGTAAAPQLLEAMGNDLGNVAAGFSQNFAYGTLALGNNTYVKLVDQSVNSGGTGPEAVYASSVVVPSGTTLDLNGLHLYARAARSVARSSMGRSARSPQAARSPWATRHRARSRVSVGLMAGSSTAARVAPTRSWWTRGMRVCPDACGAEARLGPGPGPRRVRQRPGLGRQRLGRSDRDARRPHIARRWHLPDPGRGRRRERLRHGELSRHGLRCPPRTWRTLNLNQLVDGNLEIPTAWTAGTSRAWPASRSGST